MKRIKFWLEIIFVSIVAVLAFGLTNIANAKCMTNDAWRGNDKTIHFAAGMAVSGLVTAHTKDPWRGFYAGAGVGLDKELLDTKAGGTCSLQDLLVTVAGAGLAAYTGHLILTPARGGVQIAYVTEF